MTLAILLVFAGIALPGAAAGQSPQFASVELGRAHVCATTVDGAAWCWGSNKHGQLGNGTKKDQLTPVRVSGDLRVTRVVLGGSSSSTQLGPFTCALGHGGRPYCWGNNDLGQLGDATTKDRSVPALVAGEHRFVDLAAGVATACGLTEGHVLFCWGAVGADAIGARSGGRPVSVLALSTPVEITLPGTARPVSFIADGFGDPCVLGDDGVAYCWVAEGKSLMVGPVTPPDRSFQSVELAGLTRRCGVTSSGDLFCWGPAGGRIELSLRAMSGRVALSGFGRFQMPLHGTRVKALVKSDGACTLTIEGRVLCATGEAMNGDGQPRFTPEAPDLTVATLRFRSSDRCALTTAGALHCWPAGQPPTTPLVAGLSFTTLSTNGSDACAIAAGGQVYCWGQNVYGQAGDGTRKSRATPAPVAVR
jgi:hypothetical protein